MLSAPQIGKTFAVALWLIARCWVFAGTLGWWVAPTYAQTVSGFRCVKAAAESSGILAKANEAASGMMIRLINGSVIEFRSWERPENLTGPTVHHMVLDEAQLLTHEAYATLSGRLSATLGPIRIIGNSGESEGQFKQLCDQAEDPANAHRMGFLKWTWRDRFNALGADSTSEGMAYKGFIDDQSARLPDWLFRSLYEAEWIPNTAAAFMAATIDKASCLDVALDPPQGVRHVIGWDIAQATDFTVGIPISLGPGERQARAMCRFNRCDYGETAWRIADYGRQWNAVHVIETNGPGKPVFDEIVRIPGIQVRSLLTTNESKHDAYIATSGDLEMGRLKLAKMPPLQSELKSIRYKRNPGGTFSYGAPAGLHDDTFMSLIIGNWSALRAAMPLVA